MSYKKPNNRFAPAVIAGVTIGFLVAGYQLVFGSKKPKAEQKAKHHQDRVKQKEQEQQLEKEREDKRQQEQEQQHKEKKQAAEDDQQPK